ncbi:hypothetical protein C8Q80DRAFT_1265102 [Daedaleopsis nitida]|nr:hypothetical protein C8Q80DRAFT_1265102 [Daedaleopsis nitida]
MSSPTCSPHRRRSHSASSPIPRRQRDDVRWQLALKRSRPSSIRSPSYKELANDQPEKWDVEQWRRGKRARRESNTEEFSDEACSYGYTIPSSDPISPTERRSTSGFPATSPLPCTSAAFQFFPQKKQRRHPHLSASAARSRLSREASPRGSERISSQEARRLRANAFGELHRTVAEGGEGLVRRMRDWERTRFRFTRSDRPAGEPLSAVDAHRDQVRRSGRPTSYYDTPQTVAAVAEQSEDDEEDLFIVGETCSLPTARSPPQKKRALSWSAMEVDHPEMQTSSSLFGGPSGSDRCSSPIDHSASASAYSSDDEVDMDTDMASSGVFSTPALSHTYTTSTNSSLVSLPLSLHIGESVTTFIDPSSSSTTVRAECPSPTSPHLPSTASRSEKAIAALTLAMANGAAGISDYEALLTTEPLTTLDDSHAGELWS